MLERAARMYFLEALSASRAGYIHGSGEREAPIIDQKRYSASIFGRGGMSVVWEEGFVE